MIKQFLLYALRWQLSTPILALCLYYFNFNVTTETIIANTIGSSIFFWVDKYIFKQTISFPLWQIEEIVKCVDCGEVCRGYRLVKTKNYDKMKDSNVEFRCERCSRNKLMMLREKGIEY
jgi:hypothetical protein